VRQLRATAIAAFFLITATAGIALAEPLTAILSLKKGSVISKSDLKALTHLTAVTKVSPVFTSAEQKILRSMKANYLTKSWVLELRNENSFEAVEKEIRRRGLPMNLDWNDMKVSTLQFEDLQWGLTNRGLPQNVDLDPMLVYQVPGRSGEDIDLPPETKDAKTVKVAVLDTGVDYSHPDLKGIVVTKPSECAALEKYKACLTDKKQEECDATWLNTNNPEVDQDKNGYPMDCHGWSITGKIQPGKILGKPDFEDLIGHGTHVSGIIGALRNNGVGVNGVSSHVQIIPVQVITTKPNEPLKPLSVDLDPVESPTPARKEATLGALVARGVIYAIHSGAQVMNFSMGWPETQDSEFMRSVIAEAQSRGIIIVAAAGNDSTRALLRPCAYKGVVCVGAHGPDGSISHFSNYGSGVDIFAPGLNILSTYPEALRPVRFRKTLGYEYLSGTSQATPFVSGVVAELLARGIPSNEILPRLILGSRPVQAGLALKEGSPNNVSNTLPADPLAYQKWGMGGLLDADKALKVPAQSFIMPIEKEKIEVPWDRKSSQLSVRIQLKNLWQDIASTVVEVKGEFVKSHPEAVRPRMVSMIPAQTYGAIWKSQEVRDYIATFSLDDTPNPADSRVPGDLDLLVKVQTGSVVRASYVTLEMTVLLTSQSTASDISRIPINNMPVGQTDIVPIDQYFDMDRTRREYIVSLQNQKVQQIWSLQYRNGEYDAVGGTKVQIEGDSANIELAVNARMDWDLDGQSDYVLGFLEDKSEVADAIVSPFTFYVFDHNMKVIDSFKVDSPLAQMPAEIFWQRVGHRRMPAWIGQGRDPDKKRGLRDRWENPEDNEDPEIRFYYLDSSKKLKALQKYQEYSFIDVLQPTQKQEVEGRVPVLLAHNLGTEAKPSYIYDFAVAEVIDGKVENFKKIDFFGKDLTYRNILDTRVDRIISLDTKNEYLRGTFWFGEGKPRQQRLTTIDNETTKIHDYEMGALRAQFDSALFVRGVFSGPQDQFAYVITNSEIQLHHLNRNQVAQTSLDRYSFFGQDLFINLYFPVTIRATDRDTMLPSLLVPEGSGLNRGVKILAPQLAKNGDMIELMSPARLRFKTDKKLSGCIPMETPVFEGERGTSLDFYCSQKFLRINLAY
jgi:subtilisin family serine protease